VNEAVYLVNIAVAALLSFLIGAEREYFQKSAGIRTHTLVGMGAALFMVISKYGFTDLLDRPSSISDGSRIAAQVVSGVGFLGAGLIFVRRDSVRGLTTAASIWLVSAVGMAAGAGMFVIAPGVTILYLAVTIGIRPITRLMPHSRGTVSSIRITYEDGRGILRAILESIGSHGIHVGDTRIVQQRGTGGPGGVRLQEVLLHLSGSGPAVTELIRVLHELDGVRAVSRDDLDDRE
jgi:putative Mg2+ transporter-C (MgtC) family protein